MLIDIRVLGLWLFSAVSLNLLFRDRGVQLMTIAAAATVAYAAPRRHVFKMLFFIGLFALIIRSTLFFLVSGGAFSSLTTGIREGLLFMTILCCIGAVLSSTDTTEVLRAIPKALFEAGLVVSIGATFAPHLARVASDVRDARKMRGASKRGSWISAGVLPLLATSLERSISIAESMDSRGFGISGREQRGSIYRAGAALGASCAMVGALLWAMGGWEPWAPALTISGGAVSLASFKRLSAYSPRSRYRAGRMTNGERRLIVVAGASIVLAVILPGVGDWVGPLLAATLGAPAWYQMSRST